MNCRFLSGVQKINTTRSPRLISVLLIARCRLEKSSRPIADRGNFGGEQY